MKLVCQKCGHPYTIEPPRGLTQKQSDLYKFLVFYSNKRGIPPSFDEMKRHLGLASKSAVHRIISALEERGYIRRLPHRARTIEIIR